ncbi:caspase-14-like isoform X2 [Leptonychotes weddellii]|uniref:Caspase-14-like isoform X2 n=1 Tax=Leptonychotes weddellii TaxID=9713 RepID=A0A7F8QSJ7_LEPWE|nr:caspase-14-like isoform X2 [Leptonychotes weddellii]
MERGLESCRRSESNGLWAPRITAVEELQSRVQETLDLLSPQELSNFRIFLKSVDEEPRVTPLRLELEGKSTKRLARLLVQHYCEPAAASRVLTKVLQQLRRVDLLQRWQDATAAEDRGIPRKILKRSYDCVDGELDCYDLRGKRKAFIMCVEKNRPGAQRDIHLMEEWLGQCQFEHTQCIDPNKMVLIEKIRSFRDGLNESKDDVGCCLVTLMSHGEKGFIKMEDGEKVSLEDIFEMFNNKNCPALQEKPKIFIIQACRGERRDTGVETDDEPMESDDISERRRLPTFSDYFIIYPTQADHVALRHPRTGSVMIEAMSKVFKQYGNKWHIADFFTKEGWFGWELIPLDFDELWLLNKLFVNILQVWLSKTVGPVRGYRCLVKML